jgi:hypothetical protein
MVAAISSARRVQIFLLRFVQALAAVGIARGAMVLRAFVVAG